MTVSSSHTAIYIINKHREYTLYTRLSQTELTTVALSWSVPRRRGRQAAACPQCRSQGYLEHTQLGSRAVSVPVKRATLAGRRRPGPVQTMCPGVYVSAQHGTSIPVVIVSARLRCSWPTSPVFSWSRLSELSPCQTVHIQVTCIPTRWPNHLELTSYQSHRQ